MVMLEVLWWLVWLRVGGGGVSGFVGVTCWLCSGLVVAGLIVVGVLALVLVAG
jgi:hypothetical protein